MQDATSRVVDTTSTTRGWSSCLSAVAQGHLEDKDIVVERDLGLIATTSTARGWSSWHAAATQVPPEGLGRHREELQLVGVVAQCPAQEGEVGAQMESDGWTMEENEMVQRDVLRGRNKIAEPLTNRSRMSYESRCFKIGAIDRVESKINSPKSLGNPYLVK